MRKVTRKPSIHVLESSLEDALRRYGMDSTKTRDLIRYLKRFSVPHRASISVSDTKKLPKAQGGALLSSIIYMKRKALHHQVSLIQEGDKFWPVILQAVPMIDDFCNSMGLTTKKGYALYIDQALKHIKPKTPLNWWLISNYQLVYEECRSWDIINKEDSTEKEATRGVHDYYVDKVASTTRLQECFYDNPTKYLCFIHIKVFCYDKGIPVDVYIDSQFEALSNIGVLPSPDMMDPTTSEKALTRLNQYLFRYPELKEGTSKKKTASRAFWDELKNTK